MFVEQMQTKGDALQTESQLLSTFDYAWNTINNGKRRPEDILQMLNKISSGSRTLSDVAKSLIPFTQKKIGTPINSRVFKFNRSRPKIVQDTTDCTIENNGKICGVILDDGSICTKLPVKKRVRCLEHKGMRIRRSKSESETVVESITKTIICGVIMENGSTCRREPVKGRKRCHEHKGKRIRASVPINQI
jgi:uncharacterized protein YifE (UPF0438 family)